MNEPFKLEVHRPFETFTDGEPTPTPYVIDGFLPRSAFSVLGAKPKAGKSSMSRIEAVSVAKGQSFLDRPVERGEVLLCSLEDSRQLIDRHLHLLGYDPAHDEAIHIVDELPHDITQTIDKLSEFLHEHVNVRLVILDTLAKAIRARDSNDYDEMISLCEKLRQLSRKYPVHIQALTHCKKVQPDDPFDGFLGSVGVRGEADSNVVIFNKRGERYLSSEGRSVDPWDGILLTAETITVDKAKMVTRFKLGKSLDQSVEDQKAASEATTTLIAEMRMLTFLKECGGHATVSEYVKSVTGKNETKLEVAYRAAKGKNPKIRLSGVARSKTHPQTIHLVEEPPQQSGPTSIPGQFVCCAHGDCTNQVSGSGGLCLRHASSEKGGVCN